MGRPNVPRSVHPQGRLLRCCMRSRPSVSRTKQNELNTGINRTVTTGTIFLCARILPVRTSHLPPVLLARRSTSLQRLRLYQFIPCLFFFHIHLTSLAIMTADQLMLFLESQLHWKTKVSYRSCCVNTCGLQQVSEC